MQLKREASSRDDTYLAENHMFPIEVRTIHRCDEKLGPICVWTGVCHGQLKEWWHNCFKDLIYRPSLQSRVSVESFHRQISLRKCLLPLNRPRCESRPLAAWTCQKSWCDRSNKECQPVDDSVEDRALEVEPLLLLLAGAEQLEVLSRPRDNVCKKLDHNSADVFIWRLTVVIISLSILLWLLLPNAL